MTKQEAAAMLVQLYADYSTLCDKYGWPPSDGMSEAVAQTDEHCEADKATDDIRNHTVNSPLYVIHPLYRIKEGKTSNEIALKTT